MTPDPKEDALVAIIERIEAAKTELAELLEETNRDFAGSGDVQDAIVSLDQAERRVREASEDAAHGEEQRAGAATTSAAGEEPEGD